MKNRKLALVLVVVGLAALALIAAGSFLSSFSIAYVNTQLEGGGRRVPVVSRLVDESRLDLPLEEVVVRVPQGMERTVTVDRIETPGGTTTILHNQVLARIVEAIRNIFSLGFRISGMLLIVAGAYLLFRSRYRIVEKEPPPSKA